MHEKEYMKELAALLPNTMTMVIGKRRLTYVQLLAQTSSSEVCSKASGMKADIGFDDKCKLDQSRSSVESFSFRNKIDRVDCVMTELFLEKLIFADIFVRSSPMARNSGKETRRY